MKKIINHILINFLDNYLLFIFNREYGIIKFINIILQKKTFKKTKIQCFELLYLLVNNFPSRMEKHFSIMNEICLMMLKSSFGSADEKVKALTLICLMLTKIDVNLEYTNVYVDLYKTLHQVRQLKLCESSKLRI